MKDLWLWVDDKAPPPYGFNAIAYTAEEAIDFLKTGRINHISLDYDLGNSLSGFNIAKFIERSAFDKSLDYITWQIHSTHVMSVKMRDILNNANKHWSKC